MLNVGLEGAGEFRTDDAGGWIAYRELLGLGMTEAVEVEMGREA